MVASLHAWATEPRARDLCVFWAPGCLRKSCTSITHTLIGTTNYLACDVSTRCQVSVTRGEPHGSGPLVVSHTKNWRCRRRRLPLTASWMLPWLSIMAPCTQMQDLARYTTSFCKTYRRRYGSVSYGVVFCRLHCITLSNYAQQAFATLVAPCQGTAWS